VRPGLALASFIAAAFAAAAFGSLFPPGSWYAQLVKPAWTPPSWLFGPVWTLLYLTIGVSGWMVWRRAGLSGARAAFVVFAAQLVLNAAWSWLFFGLQRPGLALVEIALLWLSIAATAELFRRVDARAGALLLPYLAWVGFAAALNAELWRLNG